MAIHEPRTAPERTDGSLDPARVLESMVDLQFVVRDRIGDLLTAPGADTLRRAHNAVAQFLETENRLVLQDPELLAHLNVEPTELLDSHRTLSDALNRVVWADAGSFALAQSIEELRRRFLDHGTLYWQRGRR
jgi:hypothetical protein